MTQQRPNVLVFFCDQLRRDLLGCYGGELVRTPNIDALAADGHVFDQAYTPTAICSPARASLLTGLYAHEHHMFNNSTPKYSYCEHLRPEVKMIQDWLDDETDCRSAYFGKWHIGPAEDFFNSRFHVKHPRPQEGRPGFLSGSHWHPNTRLGPLVQSTSDGRAGTLDVPMDEFPDVYAARRTQDFLRERDQSRPFLAFCAFPGPHSPWMVPDEFGIRYRPEDIPMPANRYDDFEGKPLGQKKLRLLAEQRAAHPGMVCGDDELRERLACCFSYLELIDQMVGDVVATLKEQGLYDETLIAFTADHGDMAGAHGYISKGFYMYDEIYRIPMIVKEPGSDTQRRFGQPVHLMDLTATLVDAVAGAPQEAMGGQPLHGRSLLPLAAGENWYKPVHYAEYHGDWYGHYSARMVTDGRWKLVWNLWDLCELYDLKNDPAELKNLFYDDEHADVRAKYFELLRKEAERTGDAHLRLVSEEVEAAFGPSIAGPFQY